MEIFRLDVLSAAHITNLVTNLSSGGVSNSVHHAVSAWTRQHKGEYFESLFSAILNMVALYNAAATGSQIFSADDKTVDLTKLQTIVEPDEDGLSPYNHQSPTNDLPDIKGGGTVH